MKKNIAQNIILEKIALSHHFEDEIEDSNFLVGKFNDENIFKWSVNRIVENLMEDKNCKNVINNTITLLQFYYPHIAQELKDLFLENNVKEIEKVKKEEKKDYFQEDLIDE